MPAKTHGNFHLVLPDRRRAPLGLPLLYSHGRLVGLGNSGPQARRGPGRLRGLHCAAVLAPLLEFAGAAWVRDLGCFDRLL